MPGKRTSNSLVFAWVLMLLAVLVFCWGLEAKLSLYKADHNKPAMSCTAKLSAEKQADRTMAAVVVRTQRTIIPQLSYVADVVLYSQGNSIPVARLRSAYLSSLTPGDESLHLFKLTRRPPPFYS